jgi:hypothetical protein
MPGNVPPCTASTFKPGQFLPDFRAGLCDAPIQRDLRFNRCRARVKAGLDADQMRAAAHINRRNQADIRDPVPQLFHRHIRGEQRARPDRLDDQRAARFLLDEANPCLIGAAERMRRRIGRRIGQHRLSRRRRIATGRQQQDQKEGQPLHAKPFSCRKSDTRPTMLRMIPVFGVHHVGIDHQHRHARLLKRKRRQPRAGL